MCYSKKYLKRPTKMYNKTNYLYVDFNLSKWILWYCLQTNLTSIFLLSFSYIFPTLDWTQRMTRSIPWCQDAWESWYNSYPPLAANMWKIVGFIGQTYVSLPFKFVYSWNTHPSTQFQDSSFFKSCHQIAFTVYFISNVFPGQARG